MRDSAFGPASIDLQHMFNKGLLMPQWLCKIAILH